MENNNNSFIITMIFVALGSMLIGAGIGYLSFPINQGTPTAQTQSPSPNQPETISTTTPATSASPISTSSTDKACDNYQCLISAASQCQPISTTISYSNIPFLFISDSSDSSIFASGKTKYEIKKTSGTNNCTLIFSPLTAYMSISDKGRKAALASGITDAEINAQLEIMNDSIKSTIGEQTVCPSNANTISAFLKDLSNGNQEAETKSNLTTGEQTTTYTTTSGQKLICTLILSKSQ